MARTKKDTAVGKESTTSVVDQIFLKFTLEVESEPGFELIAENLRQTLLVKRVYTESAIRAAIFGKELS